MRSKIFSAKSREDEQSCSWKKHDLLFCEMHARCFMQFFLSVPEMTYNVFSGTLNPTHFTSLLQFFLLKENRYGLNTVKPQETRMLIINVSFPNLTVT